MYFVKSDLGVIWLRVHFQNNSSTYLVCNLIVLCYRLLSCVLWLFTKLCTFSSARVADKSFHWKKNLLGNSWTYFIGNIVIYEVTLVCCKFCNPYVFYFIFLKWSEFSNFLCKICIAWPLLYALPDRTAVTLLSFIQENILPGTTMVSDLWRGYNGITNLPEIPF